MNSSSLRFCFYAVTFLQIAAGHASDDWAFYGGNAGGTRFSSLSQITPANVAELRPAWTYHTGALHPETNLNRKAAFEATPILIDGLLYVSTPFDQVVALNPATGTEVWKFDPKIDRSKGYSEVTSRGVSAWREANELRIYIGTLDARLIALDGKTGERRKDFGSNGEVDLTHNVMLRDPGDYQVTSPPAVVGDVVVVGSSLGDNRGVELERGVVRGFSARTGALRWTWEPIPWAQKAAPRSGAANAWGVFSADPGKDLVFVPTSSPSPDYFGGLRPGDNAYANSVVALRASTGELVWNFQVVHHDLWDYDVAAQPVLTRVNGRSAVVITTKTGMLFVLDELTGKPLHEVTEKPVPPSDVPGEIAYATQPFSDYPPLTKQSVTPADAWGINEVDELNCRKQLSEHRTGSMFTPPSIQGTVQVPANIGGVNWGSAAINDRGVLVVNTNNLALLVRLIPRDAFPAGREKAGMDNRIYGEFARQEGAPFGMYREDLLAHGQFPCTAPPWGTISAVDLNSKKILWQTPLGTLISGQQTGSPNLGGPIVTAGGVVFTGAAMDNFLRAFSLKSGKEIWKGELPASAQATPMTYQIKGKQYVVVAAGGHGKMGTTQGDAVVAFTLRAP